MSDNAETILTFDTVDGRRIEVDHLGLRDPENRGEFALYEGDVQIGEFMLPWAMLKTDIKADYALPDDAELAQLATLALADDPRVLTQNAVAEAFSAALHPPGSAL